MVLSGRLSLAALTKRVKHFGPRDCIISAMVDAGGTSPAPPVVALVADSRVTFSAGVVVAVLLPVAATSLRMLVHGSVADVLGAADCL